MHQLIQTRHRLTLVELIAILAVLVFAFVIIFPFLSKGPRPNRSQVNCAGNLKQIGLSLLMYSGDYDGYFPQMHPNFPPHNSFEPLARLNYMQDGKLWACPARSTVLSLASNSSYRYIGSGLKDDNLQAREVSLAYDEMGNHPDNKWVNVLFIDSHVEGARPGTWPWAHNN